MPELSEYDVLLAEWRCYKDVAGKCFPHARSVQQFVRNAMKYAEQREKPFTKLRTIGEEW